MTLCLTVVYTRTPTASRRALYVRSLSHWAPASTGQCSQAITVVGNAAADDDVQDETTYFSGVLGLVPETLSTPQELLQREEEEEDGVDRRTVDVLECENLLALRHCHRLLEVSSCICLA